MLIRCNVVLIQYFLHLLVVLLLQLCLKRCKYLAKLFLDCIETFLDLLAWLIASRGTASNYVFDLVIYVSTLFVELFNRHVWLRLEENK